MSILKENETCIKFPNQACIHFFVWYTCNKGCRARRWMAVSCGSARCCRLRRLEKEAERRWGCFVFHLGTTDQSACVYRVSVPITLQTYPSHASLLIYPLILISSHTFSLTEKPQFPFACETWNVSSKLGFFFIHARVWGRKIKSGADIQLQVTSAHCFFSAESIDATFLKTQNEWS